MPDPSVAVGPGVHLEVVRDREVPEQRRLLRDEADPRQRDGVVRGDFRTPTPTRGWAGAGRPRVASTWSCRRRSDRRPPPPAPPVPPACSHAGPRSVRSVWPARGLDRHRHAAPRTPTRATSSRTTPRCPRTRPVSARRRATLGARGGARRGSQARSREGPITNVPCPGRPSTSPSCSSWRYAFSTVFGLIARDSATSRTVGSRSPVPAPGAQGVSNLFDELQVGHDVRSSVEPDPITATCLARCSIVLTSSDKSHTRQQ